MLLFFSEAEGEIEMWCLK